MQFKSYVKSKLPLFVVLGFVFLLTSCGSYQYAGYDNDGIYNSNGVVYEETPQVETSANNNGYYKAYFTEKSQQYEEIPQSEEIIFTDIESYEGDYYNEQDSTQVADSYKGYAGWGDNSTEVSINYYNNFGYGFWGYNYWGYNPYNWRYWNYSPYWNVGWNSGWGWNVGWGWGYYDPWYSPYYGGYYGGYYGYPYYGYPNYRRPYATYNAGRRGYPGSYNNAGGRVAVNRSRQNSTLTRDYRSSVRRNTNTLTRSTSRSSSIQSNRSSNTVRRNSNSNFTRRNNNSNVRPRNYSTPSRSTPSMRSGGSSRGSMGTRGGGSRSSSGRRR
ncbi:hypothetical protein [Mangrovimonas sp. YM274]|uniref:hypothetical protein n=1 Tax=Mangrovimonas sp. YM274 TaxID=3070660 RepID=UPI0027DC8173|nr:hypothetical protein [Mangrovimonas sp. YM274]WMI67930.1 hypothetical protein RBH95_12355 [Mangrovimonas sp. YM274]